MKIFRLIIILVFAVSLCSKAQNVRDSSLFAPMLGFSYAFQIPGGDMAKRFGVNHNAQLGFSIKTKKRFVFGIDGSLLFGSNINETNMLDSLATKAGFILNADGQPGEVNLYERGFTVSATFGYVFNVFAANKNSGLITTFSLGLLQHYIKIENVQDQIPILSDDYLKGYDRLTNGLNMTEFVGYLFLGNRRFLNFIAGFEFSQAFTQSRRSYDFDKMRKDDTQRLDMLYSFRVGWILPLYKRLPKQFYYY